MFFILANLKSEFKFASHKNISKIDHDFNYCMYMSKSVFFCSDCGNEFPKWVGQCSGCQAWNTIKEMKNVGAPKAKNTEGPQSLSLLTTPEKDERMTSGISEFDRVLGGGFLKDALILLTGDPGIGKSTLALQAALSYSQKQKVLYISGEESVSQISSRAFRISKKQSENGQLQVCPESNLENILTLAHKELPSLLIIDSIQTISSDNLPGVSGSVGQIRYCAEQIMHVIKKLQITCMLIGHVTKDGELSGPQTLAHLVDTVLYLEGDKYNQFRILRGQKNRFGTTDEIGVFEMKESGLQEITNPSECFLEGKQKNAAGSVILSTMEGSRPFLVELQALCAHSPFGYPKRTSSGMDINRVHIMLAVLQKHGGEKMESLDVFINIIGGLKIKEHAADLGLLVAIASSKRKWPIPDKLIILGEVGLSGEIRSIPFLEKRLKEAEKLGFTHAIIPQTKEKLSSKIKTSAFSHIADVLQYISKPTS
ncbi:DNA repair protein RadA [Candidatus Peregrinibacteria bacterium]|nr:MAG: DNA repair protein RadA [Candidatus Peregrinibacteria bacterium]